MNRLLSMAQVRSILGMEGKSNRLIQRRLKIVAEERSVAFQLFRVGPQQFFTTEQDLRRLIPELWAHEAQDADSLRSLVQAQAIELRELRKRVERVENAQFTKKHTS